MRLVSKILAEKRKREPVRPRALKNNVPGLFGVHDKRKLAKRAVYCFFENRILALCRNKE